MKAWGCMDYEAECGYIVFAETRGKAHSLVMGEDGFDCSEWTDVNVRRIKEIDGRINAECVADWQKNVRLYYEARWFPEQGASSCDWCSLYRYDEIPESHIEETDEGDLCVTCRAQKQREAEAEQQQDKDHGKN